jgi:hypothetical protein
MASQSDASLSVSAALPSGTALVVPFGGASEYASDVSSCKHYYAALPWHWASEFSGKVSLPVMCQALSVMQPDRQRAKCQA